MAQFRLKSCESSTELLFSDLTDDGCQIELQSSDVLLRKRVFFHNDEEILSSLFEDMASAEAPWNQPKSWQSPDDDVRIDVSCTPSGHVWLQVRFKSTEPPDHEGYELFYRLKLEFQQLQDLAVSAKDFFMD